MILKFRVWLPDPDVKRVLRVKALVFEDGKTRCVCGYSYDFYLEDEDAILMQSTGMFDRNGQEIFEGDILKVTDTFDETEGSIEVVFYSQGQALFATKDIDKNIYKLCNTLMFDVEIIGNIYEDSELLN